MGKFRRSLPNSALGKAFLDPDLDLWRKNALPRLNSSLLSLSAVAPESILPHAFGEWLLCFATPDGRPASSPGLPQPALLIRQPTQGTQRFAAFLKQELFRQWPELGDCHFQYGQIFLFCADPDLGADLASQITHPPARPRNPRLAQSWDSQAVANLWVDLPSILMPILNSTAVADDSRKFAGLEVLGLGNVDICQSQVQLQDPGFRLTARMEFAGPRTGAFDILAPGGAQKALPSTPAGTYFLLSLALRNPADLWTELRPALAMMMPSGAYDDMELVFGNISQALQIDFPNDVLEILDGRLSLAVGAALRCPAFALLSLGVKDAPAARRLLDQQVPSFLNLFGAVAASSHRGVAYDVFSPQDSPLNPAYGLIGDSIVAASDASAFCLAVEARAASDTLALSSRFRLAADKIKIDGSAAVLYLDAAPLARPALGLALSALSPRAPKPQALSALFAGVPDPAILSGRVGPAVASLKTEERAFVVEAYSEGQALGHAILMAPVLAPLLPDFRERRLSARLTQATDDLQAMAMALEVYRVDNGAYPLSTADRPARPGAADVSEMSVDQLDRLDPALAANLLGEPAPTFYISPDGRPANLTTPIQYLAQFPPDPFAPERKYGYYTAQDGWILFSCGPDQVFDIDPLADYDPELGARSPELIRKTYDPTNGLASDGDIWRTLY